MNTVHGMAFGSIKGRNVKQIAFSLEGDAIYSVVPVPQRKVKVTVLRMSSRDLVNTTVFLDSVSIFPTRDGIVLLKHDRVAELWSFDMSTCLRPLPNVTGCDIVSSVSAELIACCSSVPFYELSEDSEDLEDQDSDNSGDWLGYMDESSDSEDYLTKSELIINYLGVNRTKSTTVSSLHTVLDAGEEILSVFCINPSEVLVCTSKDIEVFNALLVKVKLSLRKNGLILWERTAFWIDPRGKRSVLCSSKHEFVVTWNTLEEGHGLHILNADTGETLHVFLGDQNDIVDCKFLDDESVVCCSGDNFLRLYNVRAGVLLSILDIGEQPFCLGACLYQPLVAIGLSGTRIKFVHVQLPKETKKTARLVSFISLSVIAVN